MLRTSSRRSVVPHPMGSAIDKRYLKEKLVTNNQGFWRKSANGIQGPEILKRTFADIGQEIKVNFI